MCEYTAVGAGPLPVCPSAWADDLRQLSPVGGVEPAGLGRNRHEGSLWLLSFTATQTCPPILGPILVALLRRRLLLVRHEPEPLDVESDPLFAN